jgi:transposase
MQEYYAGIDVSLELASVCIVDANGKVVKETKVESHPDALVALFNDLRLPMAQIGLEAGPLSQWLHAGLTQAGFETVLLETRHVKAALSAMTVKTDRKDARGIQIARYDKVCLQFMTVPSVGPLTAITYKSAIDDPQRIKKSKAAGPLFGLTPRKYQSGETDVTGGITRVGDEMVRTALYEAANSLLSPKTRFSALKRWGLEVAQRRGLKRAKVAVARKLAVILHRMWIDGTPFRWSNADGAHTDPSRAKTSGSSSCR